MNKICVIAKNKNTYFINRLKEEVQGGVVLFDPWSDLELPAAERYLCRTTGIYHSDLDLLILGSLPPEKVINPVPVLKRFRSKTSQWVWFEENNFPCLPWLSLKTEELLSILKFARLYPEMVIKPDVGQGGWGIEGVNQGNIEAWLKKKKKLGDLDYLIQPLIKDAEEYRYFFIEGEAPVVLKRKALSGIAANFQRQGVAEISSFPENFRPEVDRLIALSGARYGAIDLFIQNDRLIVLELNTVPGFEQVEKISGHNLIQKLIEIQ